MPRGAKKGQVGGRSFHCARQKGEGVAALLTASLEHRERRLDEATATGALRPKGKLPPDHRMTQRALARVVRRFDPLVPQKYPPPLAVFVQFPARTARVGMTALRAAQQQTFDLATNRAHPTQERRARNPTGTISGPMLEQFARRVPQAKADVFRPLATAVDHRRKIAFQVGPAPLQAPQVPVHFGTTQLTTPRGMLHPRKRRRLAGGTNREHREDAGYEGPLVFLVAGLPATLLLRLAFRRLRPVACYPRTDPCGMSIYESRASQRGSTAGMMSVSTQADRAYRSQCGCPERKEFLLRKGFFVAWRATKVTG